ncbi:hypothetical protein BS47DRAFT_1295925 [Hydnum rufescens UP504]|uniref:Amino acid permease/ SLC12A domain-containing protein n=1 Tax=Hydnum rufescens UP504 TaxID=1448309 RepID=A0A9P6AXD9_9AGAM|nr:hypothetical protein BS47DRAFT_1295925 [Hydnum rufescens UP504]
MADYVNEKGDSILPARRGQEAHQGLKRQLKARHITMISIGGAIGTGLFLGTGNALKNGGLAKIDIPSSLLLGYVIIGTICYAMMLCLGEMVSYLPIPGGHIKLAERFVNPALSFAMGWNYWYNWVIVLPAELSAAGVLIDYWEHHKVNDAAWITICLVVVIVINMLGAGAYGEAEFFFVSFKVITIVGILILGVVLDLGGGPNHDRIGFRYWKSPGPFVQYNGIGGAKGRFLGWWSVMVQAAFSYIGTEIVGIAAGEAKNPRRNLPKAIKRVYVRILLFYIGGAWIIGWLVPSTDPHLGLTTDGASSPFVIAISRAGIKGLPSVINAAILTSAWSAASSDLFTSSRALCLAISRNAPKIFARTSKTGLPFVSVIFCALFCTLSYMDVKSGSGKVFGWFLNLSTVAGLMTWFGIAFTYVRFYAGLKAQGYDRSKLPFFSRLQPYAAWYVIISTLVICFFSGFHVFLQGSWKTADFITNYLSFILFPIWYFGARYGLYKSPMVDPANMDFITGVAEAQADSYDEPPPRNILEKFWLSLM